MDDTILMQEVAMTDQPGSHRPTRRGVLKGGGLAVATPALASALPPPTPMALVLPDAEVAGIGHHASPEALRAMVQGLRVILRREPHNGHDPHAVAIHLASGEKIGYVPRHLNIGIAGLLDAGHTLAGEITDPERREFETRLSGDQKPFPGRVILAEAGSDDSGRRKVLMADIRPRFRAFLTTGHPDDAPLPDPDALADDPGWRRLAPEFEPMGAFRAATDATVRSSGEALTVSDNGHSLLDAAGRHAGTIEAPDVQRIRQARDAGLSVKAVITRIRHEQADEHGPAYIGYWVELRVNGRLPPPPFETEQARISALRSARSTLSAAADHLHFVVRSSEQQRKHDLLLQQIAREKLQDGAMRTASIAEEPPEGPPLIVQESDSGEAVEFDPDTMRYAYALGPGEEDVEVIDLWDMDNWEIGEAADEDEAKPAIADDDVER